MWVRRRVQKSVRLYLVGVCVDPTTSPSVMSFDAQFCHNLPINVRQMHVMLLCAELAGLRGAGVLRL